ncbi:preprotein translocase subunit SecA, partial [Microgenomates group bacterium RIFCSPLOWO2_01_FULL_46_13]
MLKILSKLFDTNAKELKKMEPVVAAINEWGAKLKKLKDKDLAAKTDEFRLRLTKGETLDDLLPEAFAAVREASQRTLDLTHYDVQMMAGIAFHQGKVAEQKTGEGKTLSATLALYLNALTGQGAHLVTVNDYLAQRDAGWMGPIFDTLGLTVGVIYSGKGDQPAAIYDTKYSGEERGDSRLEHLRPVPRKEAYQADITYGTNNEFGFDYLRDNMTQTLAAMVQRGHHFAIVDEVDSILIDEARTPLIISAPDTEPTEKYYRFAGLIKELTKDTDYNLDEKLRSVTLTDYGLRRLERKLGIDNLYEKDFDVIHHVEQALKALTLFRRDRDYVLKDNQIIIVDEHTGRLMFGRRYSEGLHQAIEAKENVPIQQESRTLATISLQNYFRMYEKLAGMTGTAATEAEEFKKIYDIEVMVIPTNKPTIRKDYPDQVFKTTRAKYGAIVKEVAERFEAGQPVLLGTRSIEHNEIISGYLKRKKILHQVLNAKNHEQEALVIANAGKQKAVTVATNIAGRGVDIVLGGAPPEDKADKKGWKEWEINHNKVVEFGGLHIIGSERHEARRIDNQLRGRGGRQGDPGSSRFYVALDDEIMRLFGGEQVARLMDMLKIPEDQPIEAGMVSKAIEQAQHKVEGFHFDQRKRLVEYDDVMNKQREIIYKRRLAILTEGEGEEGQKKLSERVKQLVHDEIQAVVVARAGESFTEVEREAMVKEFVTIIPFDTASQSQLSKRLSKENEAEAMVAALTAIADKTYSEREKLMGSETMRQIEKFVMLMALDSKWMDHIDAIDDLREGIWLRGDKTTVLSEYKKEAFEMFETLLSSIDTEVARRIFRIQPANMPVTPLPIEILETKKEEAVELPGEKAVERRQTTGDFAAAMSRTIHKASNPDRHIALQK